MKPHLQCTGNKPHLKDHWISSRVLPFVSGTQMDTNTTVKALTAVYIAKVPVESSHNPLARIMERHSNDAI